MPSISRAPQKTANKSLFPTVVANTRNEGLPNSTRRVSQSKKTSEFSRGRRLFLTDKSEIGPEELAAEIRRRWNVENKNHHPRDGLAFLEEKCRCRTDNTAANLALMRGAVLTLWRKNDPDIPSTAFVRRRQMRLDESIKLITKHQSFT